MVASSVPHDYRWTIDEYVLRCALSDNVTDLLVEGKLDRWFYEEVLNRHDLSAVSVFDADFLQVPDQEVRDAGFAPGAKGRLLTLAAALVYEATKSPLRCRVVVVVDHDYDGVPEAIAPFALATDGYEVENYACTVTSLRRFVRYIMGAIRSPDGASGRSRGRVAVDGAEILERVLSAAAVVSAVCRVLYFHHVGVGIIGGWPRRFAINSTGGFDCDASTLLRDSLLAFATTPSDADVEALRTEQQFVDEDRARRVRGKDFAVLLHKLLKSPWAGRETTVKFAAVDESDFRRWLVGQADPISVDKSLAVVELVSRFN